MDEIKALWDRKLGGGDPRDKKKINEERRETINTGEKMKKILDKARKNLTKKQKKQEKEKEPSPPEEEKEEKCEF